MDGGHYHMDNPDQDLDDLMIDKIGINEIRLGVPAPEEMCERNHRALKKYFIH